MSPILLLMKGISAAIVNRHLEQPLDIEHSLKRLLEDIRMPAPVAGESDDADVAIGLREALAFIIERPDKEISAKEIINRVKIIIKTDHYYSSVLNDILVVDDFETEEDLKLRVRTCLFEINEAFGKQNIQSAIKSAHKEIFDLVDTDAQIKFLTELAEKVEGLKKETLATRVKEKDENELDFDNEEDVLAAMIKASESLSMEGLIKTGYKGINNMLAGGIFPGAYMNTAALTYGYKSGFLQDLFMHVPMFNKPKNKDPNKKPLNLRISFENTPVIDMPQFYKRLAEQQFGKRINYSDIDPKEVQPFLKKVMGVNGWHNKLRYFAPEGFTVDNLIAVLQDYEEQGYVIEMLTIDYLELILDRSSSKSHVRSDELITLAIHKVRSYCYHRGIACVSAHQLSSEALSLAREGKSNLTVLFANGGYYMGSKTLNTKLDIEICSHVHKLAERSYVEFARGKHRMGESTPKKYLHIALPFQPIGGLHPDVHLEEDYTIYDVSSIFRGSMTTSDHEEAMFS